MQPAVIFNFLLLLTFLPAVLAQFRFDLPATDPATFNATDENFTFYSNALGKYTYKCSGHPMPQNIDGAVAKLNTWCQSGMVPTRRGHIFRDDEGGTQVYYCNFGSARAEPCDQGDYDTVNAIFDQHCGMGHGAWAWVPNWGNVGIGRDPAGVNECGMDVDITT
jgi:hypothetical protein